jgi:hypothetical protein
MEKRRESRLKVAFLYVATALAGIGVFASVVGGFFLIEYVMKVDPL